MHLDRFFGSCYHNHLGTDSARHLPIQLFSRKHQLVDIWHVAKIELGVYLSLKRLLIELLLPSLI